MLLCFKTLKYGIKKKHFFLIIEWLFELIRAQPAFLSPPSLVFRNRQVEFGWYDQEKLNLWNVFSLNSNLSLILLAFAISIHMKQSNFEKISKVMFYVLWKRKIKMARNHLSENCNTFKTNQDKVKTTKLRAWLMVFI